METLCIPRSAVLPPLPCPRCGVIDIPVLGPGVGPHVGQARCREGHFIKWLPRAVVGGTKKEHIMGGVNRVVLLGTISKYGVEVRYATSGTPCASFVLVVSEQGQDGKDHPTLIPCELWGKKAEAAGELEPGQLVLFEGKLKKRPKGEGQWELVVSGVEVTPVQTPALTGSAH